MANPEHLEILKRGVEAWNEWRESEKKVHPNLKEIDFRATNLRRANLYGVNLQKALLNDSDLTEADLNDADLEGVSLKNSVLRGANLCNANLYGADLQYAVLDSADLMAADLGNTKLQKAILSNTTLSGADLSNADLSGADLSGAYLPFAILTDTDLSFADLSRADFRGANLRGAIFDLTIMAFTYLRECKGLEQTKHEGPSAIEGRTTKLDYKKLPIKFLTGCGLNKWQVEAIKLNDPDLSESQITDIVYEIDRLRNISPIQPYSIFISYSRQDEVFVEQVEKLFKEKDIRYWRDVHHATAGPLEKQITTAMHINPTVLLVLSENSVKSDWVQFEVRKARELEKKLGRHVICPVTLDSSWKTCDWPERLRYQIEEYNILDFSKWEDKEFFQSQFGKLLKGLNVYYRNES